MNYLPQILIMVLLVVMSGYFSATETSFSSLNKTRVKTLAEKGNKRAKLALSLTEEYDRLISTILIGNNIVNIALASMGTVFFVELLESNGATVSTVVITVVVLIFGEITPKSIAKDCAEGFAMFSAPIICTLIFLLTPINFLFTVWKKMISKILRVETSNKMSQDELIMMVNEVEQDGAIDTDEGDLLRNAIEFTEQRAEDVLTHRVDIEAVPIEATAEEIADVFRKTQFSRLLVYRETIDNIIGVIHLKDFYTGDYAHGKDISEILSVPLFVQKSERINSLLKKLQKNKSHIAIILDEYGGTLGIVTMEDILEELVGEIWDEHDEVVEVFRKVSENLYKVDGTVEFDKFCEFFGIEPEYDGNTIGGWIMEAMERVPEVGDSFRYENLSVTVVETDAHRISELMVEVLKVSVESEMETDEVAVEG